VSELFGFLLQLLVLTNPCAAALLWYATITDQGCMFQATCAWAVRPGAMIESHSTQKRLQTHLCIRRNPDPSPLSPPCTAAQHR
jgi:hypothetical protein